ncbi:MAG: hypothetical protein LBS29_01040 [Endomicrobium sp.]|jgi:uncharacterized protein YcfL|uniref:hypothetical protein n=1 Tax=Candidatus Endomicrobiellum cubanum TaxID=3242325 RepID=UPI00282EFE41|nr:hypothetical protein [Endomicrobium sp.]MDR2395404.1 hypothetical protein [Endomicrobium sp.]
MRKISFLAALSLFLSFGLVSCSSNKGEQAQEPSQEAVEEQVVEVETSTSQAAGTATETSNVQSAE